MVSLRTKDISRCTSGDSLRLARKYGNREERCQLGCYMWDLNSQTCWAIPRYFPGQIWVYSHVCLWPWSLLWAERFVRLVSSNSENPTMETCDQRGYRSLQRKRHSERKRHSPIQIQGTRREPFGRGSMQAVSSRGRVNCWMCGNWSLVIEHVTRKLSCLNHSAKTEPVLPGMKISSSGMRNHVNSVQNTRPCWISPTEDNKRETRWSRNVNVVW